MNRSSRTMGLLALALATLLVTSCVPETSQVEKGVPNEISIILGRSPSTLMPYSPVVAARQVGSLIFRGLFDMDESGMPVPDLCVEIPTSGNGGITDGGRTITYTLLEAAWDDGEPVTAHDVEFTWSLLEAGLLFDEPAADLSVVESLEAVDDRTVRVRLSHADAPAAWRIIPFVLPEHLLGDSGDILSDRFWYEPVGCGSYRVTEYARGQYVRLEPTASGGTATLSVYFAIDDSVARAQFDDSGAVVWIDASVPAVTLAERSDVVASTAWRAFFFNLDPERVTSDPAVRAAISAVTTPVVPGEGLWGASDPLATGPLGLTWAPLSVDDPAGVLEAAGWTMGQDGVRQKDGRALEVVLVVPALVSEEGYRMEALMSAWSSIGVSGDFLIDGESQFMDGFEGRGRIFTGDYDVAWMELPWDQPPGWAWSYDSSDVPSAVNPEGLNVSRVSDTVLQEAYTRMLEATDPEDLGVAFSAAWERIEAIGLVAWEGPLPSNVLSKGVLGVEAHPSAENALAGVGGWRVEALEASGGECE